MNQGTCADVTRGVLVCFEARNDATNDDGLIVRLKQTSALGGVLRVETMQAARRQRSRRFRRSDAHFVLEPGDANLRLNGEPFRYSPRPPPAEAGAAKRSSRKSFFRRGRCSLGRRIALTTTPEPPHRRFLDGPGRRPRQRAPCHLGSINFGSRPTATRRSLRL